MTRDWRYLSAGMGLAVAVLAWLVIAGAAIAGRPFAVPVTRTLEPVILAGERLPAFEAAPLDNLFAYAYSGTQWTPIPFQIDEVDAGGTYTVGDGLLDGNDELVFMAMDLGAQALAGEWLTDTGSQAYPRYELAITNPLAPDERGWVYLYRSAALSPPPAADYVDWDAAGSRFVAGAYVMGFDSATHAGIDSLELNGSGVDVLDRSKMRINVDCYIFGFPVNITLTEDDLAGQIDQTPSIDGPVRAGGGSTEGSTWAYYALNRSHVLFDLADLEPPPQCTSVVVRWLRLSSDWLDPLDSGMAPAVYYDANTAAGVPVDGSPDAVPAFPAAGWRQVSGARGTMVSVAGVALGGGTLSNYYKDNQTPDPTDTGDGLSFGDAGARVDGPAGQVSVDMLSYVLDPNQPNVGDLFQSYYQHPLVVGATEQSYPSPCDGPVGPAFDWTPQPVYADSSTAFSATLAGGDPPFTYTWMFGDDGSVSWGNPVGHIFALSGTFPVTLTVSNACEIADPLTLSVNVLVPSPRWRVYLPLSWKH